MASALRHAPVGRPLHVRTRATGGEKLFRDEHDYDRMLWLFGRQALVDEWICLAYCLMPTHVHFVLTLTAPNLSGGMQRILSTYAQRFNARHGRAGHLVECRFRCSEIRTEQHLYEVMRYVPLNPCTQGGSRPEDWRYSSYAATLGLLPAPAFLDVPRALSLFDRRPERARETYRAFVEQRLKEPCPAL